VRTRPPTEVTDNPPHKCASWVKKALRSPWALECPVSDHKAECSSVDYRGSFVATSRHFRETWLTPQLAFELVQEAEVSARANKLVRGRAAEVARLAGASRGSSAARSGRGDVAPAGAAWPKDGGGRRGACRRRRRRSPARTGPRCSACMAASLRRRANPDFTASRCSRQFIGRERLGAQLGRDGA